MSDSKWDKQNDLGKNSTQTDAPRTIVISQPIKKVQRILSNDVELTDDYLNSVLPSRGFKIIPPPPNYIPVKRAPRADPARQESNPGLPRVPDEFMKLYTDLRPDDELSSDEQKERLCMKLLIQMRDGNTRLRKLSMRYMVTHAESFGAQLIFSKLLPLFASNTIGQQERHTLAKLLDRLMYRLADKMASYVPPLLGVVGKMLVDNDPVARAEAREITTNLAKIGGLSVVIKSLRASIDSPDKATRTIAAQTLATAAYALGVPSIFPFVRALVKTNRDWKFKQVGVRILNNVAFLSGNGILPFLPDMIEIIQEALASDNSVVVKNAISCITAMAEAVAPHGGKFFEAVVADIWNGIRNQGTFTVCMKCAGSLLTTMDQGTAARNFAEIRNVILRVFNNGTNEAKLTCLVVFEQALKKGIIDTKGIEDIIPSFFASFWNLKSTLDTRIQRHLAPITVEIAKRSTMINVVNYLFNDFKQQPADYRRLVIETFDHLIDECGTENLLESKIYQIVDDLVFAFEDIKEDSRREMLYTKCLSSFVQKLGTRVLPMLDQIKDLIYDRISHPNSHMRKLSAELLAIFAESFVKCNKTEVLLHFYGVLQEFLGEEYPEVLAAILDATNAMICVLDAKQLKPPPDDIVSRLVPILKNRHDKVAYSCVMLIKNLSIKSSDLVHKKEWLRICFELLEMLRAEKKKVRTAAVETFSYIAKVIGPFDVLLSLLNNLQVQERQIRICTTAAIAVLAENCGPYNILPALMNEYRTPDVNVQNGALKGLQFLFQTIGPQCADYCYAVVPLLTHALIERDPVHRQIACLAVKNFTIGCFAAGKQDAIIHLLNHLMPNIFETTLHFIDAVIDALEAMQLTLGPGIILQYVMNGLFHPARKARSQFWRIYNNLVIYSGDSLVPYYPLLQNTQSNNYHRDEFDVFI